MHFNSQATSNKGKIEKYKTKFEIGAIQNQPFSNLANWPLP